MSIFTCSNCKASCCSCQGCHRKATPDGKVGCSKCLPGGTNAAPPLPQRLPARPPSPMRGAPRPPIVNRAYWTRNRPNV